jgi:hypothetical protein
VKTGTHRSDTFSSETVVEIRLSAPAEQHDPDRLIETINKRVPDMARRGDFGIELYDATGTFIGGLTETSLVLAQFNPKAEPPLLSRLRLVWNAWCAAEEICEVERVGIRGPFVIGFDRVEEAVQAFRRHLFEYYGGGTFEGLGKPVEVAASLAFADWHKVDGASLGLGLQITPIHILPELQKRFGGTPYAGGLLIDMDRYSLESLEGDRVLSVVRAAMTAGVRTAEMLGRRFKTQEKGGDSGAAWVDTA